jgi:hypothetical protein
MAFLKENWFKLSLLVLGCTFLYLLQSVVKHGYIQICVTENHTERSTYGIFKNCKY